MKNLFNDTDEQEHLNEISIILDKAKNESSAKNLVLEHYLCLVEDENIFMDVEMIVDLAEEYGYDFSDLQEKIEASL